MFRKEAENMEDLDKQELAGLVLVLLKQLQPFISDVLATESILNKSAFEAETERIDQERNSPRIENTVLRSKRSSS